MTNRKRDLMAGYAASIATRLCLLVIFSANFSAFCLAQESDSALSVFAARIQMRTWSGAGIYLERGMFITAAHVIGHNSRATEPRILVAGIEYPSRILKHGSIETIDLTLLGVDETQLLMRLRLRRNPLCANPPSPGQQIVTV